ncbi:Fungalysin/Thermolysin Extracellular metalloproteinase 5 [Allomyces javanicus]|nr:Fungalysin/Thermolysin Extracellular metalloproteinase 5 [Allomyces javanicus]
MNIAHELTYQDGFDEQSGNFLVFNFNKGGLGNDKVLSLAQDATNINDSHRVIPDFDFVIPHHEYPYSTDLAVKPSTYSFLAADKYKEPHKMGEVWASMLFEMYLNFVDVYEGNALWLQLFMNGLKLQVCNPDFITERDSTLLAYSLLTGGANNCLIWSGFVKRGPGDYVDSNDRSALIFKPFQQY